MMLRSRVNIAIIKDTFYLIVFALIIGSLFALVSQSHNKAQQSAKTPVIQDKIVVQSNESKLNEIIKAKLVENAIPAIPQKAQPVVAPEIIKPYVAPVCTTTPVPYKTISKDAPYIEKGKTREYGGRDGYVKTCTSDSNGYKPADVTIPAYNKTVYVGSYVPKAEIVTDQNPEDSSCTIHSRTNIASSSAPENCYFNF